MKYLKRFNESKQDKIDELKDFCEESLVHLIDEGFVVDFIGDDIQHITLSKKMIETFSWDEVRDYFMPFLNILLKRYDFIKSKYVSESSDYYIRFGFLIEDNVDFGPSYHTKFYKIDQLDNLKEDKINYIRFSVKI